MAQSDSNTAKNLPIDLDSIPTLPELPKTIPIESIIALRKKNLSMSQIAKVLGCSKPNIVQRLNAVGYRIDRLNNFKEVKADILELELQQNIQSITDADRKKAGYRDKIVSAGILIDKIQLLTGNATQILGYADTLKARETAEVTVEQINRIIVRRTKEVADTKG